MSLPVTIIILLLLAPVSIYLSVRFGRFAYLQATELFEQQKRKQNQPKSHE